MMRLIYPLSHFGLIFILHLTKDLKLSMLLMVILRTAL